jgi:hypothetical protein
MTSTPPPPATAASSTLHGREAIARRARIEHLAMDLLRMADAVWLPVPVDGIWRSPPGNLWPPPRANQQTLLDSPDDPYVPRYQTARDIARFVSDSAWDKKDRMLGGKPLDGDERHIFALALLIPTALLLTLSERQLSSAGLVATIFQVPVAMAQERLQDLGYKVT